MQFSDSFDFGLSLPVSGDSTIHPSNGYFAGGFAISPHAISPSSPPSLCFPEISYVKVEDVWIESGHLAGAVKPISWHRLRFRQRIQFRKRIKSNAD
jgi:hypothetical protein